MRNMDSVRPVLHLLPKMFFWVSKLEDNSDDVWNRWKGNSEESACSHENNYVVGRRLLTIHEIPLDFREVYITTGYREPGSSALQCIHSVFRWNNETLNFWTHYLAFLFFLWKFGTLEFNLFFDSSCWPLLSFAIGSCSFALFSSLAHAFSSMDVKIRHICFFFDYAGVSIYSIGSSIGFYYYSTPDFLRHSFAGQLYIPVNAFLAVFSCIACCLSRHQIFKSHQYMIRTLAFAIPYSFASSFLVCRLLTSSFDTVLWFHYSQFFWCFMIAFTNTTKLPERYISKSFDIIGHSHQWFHVFAFLAANHQINAMVIDMRELKLKSEIFPVTFLSTLGMVGLVVLANFLVVAYFSFRIMKLRTKFA